jgi:1,4-dihydroxy-2-naphthoyl-CoA hydrolase
MTRLSESGPLPRLPGALGMRLHDVTAEFAETTLRVTDAHLAATGYLHAGCVVTLADTACGYGCLATLSPGAGFTTISLATNHLRTASGGQRLRAVASPLHLGRTTQVWDATVTATGDGDTYLVAVFRCTQLVLDPK